MFAYRSNSFFAGSFQSVSFFETSSANFPFFLTDGKRNHNFTLNRQHARYTFLLTYLSCFLTFYARLSYSYQQNSILSLLLSRTQLHSNCFVQSLESLRTLCASALSGTHYNGPYGIRLHIAQSHYNAYRQQKCQSARQRPRISTFLPTNKRLPRIDKTSTTHLKQSARSVARMAFSIVFNTIL